MDVPEQAHEKGLQEDHKKDHEAGYKNGYEEGLVDVYYEWSPFSNDYRIFTKFYCNKVRL